MGLMDLIFGKRDALPSPVNMIGFPSDGGLLAGGVTPTTAIGLSAVWRCLDILANGVSQLEWRETRGNLILPTSRIVARPQAQRTRREWTSLVVSTLALYDVAYALKVGGEDSEGVPIGLWYMDPGIVAPGTTNLFSTLYLLPPDDFFVAQQMVKREQLVIMHRSPQPTISDTAGGIINLARATFAAAIAAERYASRYWQAGGSPTTVLETEQRLTKPQIDETSELWAEKRARGPDYAPVLSGGLKARSFGADPTSESAVEARRELVADIGRYFGVPTRILNAPTGDSQTYHTSEASNQDLVRYTLQNYIDAIQDAISDELPGGRRMVMDAAPLTRGVQLNRAQAWQLALGGKPWMSKDEVRDIEGLPPTEDPEDALIPDVAGPVPVGVAGTPQSGGSNG
jgi:HK97 family phage portal protein